MSSLSPILDVVIGLAAVYAAFSLLASWCNEHVASWLQLRSKGLESALLQLLNGNSNAWKAFTTDPMYQALQQAADASYATRGAVKQAKLRKRSERGTTGDRGCGHGRSSRAVVHVGGPVQYDPDERALQTGQLRADADESTCRNPVSSPR